MECIEDEIPFYLPIGWSWGRLQSFCFPISDGTHQTPTYTDEGYIFLSAKNVTSWKIDWDNVTHIPESLHNELSKRISPKRNDILLAKNGTIGVAAIVDRDCDFDIYVTLAVLRTIQTSILPQYLLNAIASSTVQNEFRGSLKGIGVQNLHLEHIRRILIPIPPFKEQKLISDKVVEITPILEHIADTYAELGAGVSVLKTKILDLAIRGELVPQNPSDEPASVLLERIRAEKEELIRQGKIKRDKKESVIFKGEDNSYYDMILPSNWSWASLSEISLGIVDGSHNPPPSSFKGIPILSAVNIYDNRVNHTSATRWITEDEWVVENKRANIEKGDVLLTIVGSIGRTAMVADSIKFALQRSVAVIKPCIIDSEFLMHSLQSPMINEWLISNAKGNAQLGIYLKDLSKLIIPIPPIEEQIRIVQKIKHALYLMGEINI